ncbi:MAG: 3,4-dihydroxy-2-butanone-4-phosphate synthase [Candidatus Methanoplasma sp.]|jgi:3,4-dihydroxy 2-butanone 4-phosphate synthase|nr:3,4-dihydroxy-2-butanone-4-phosphate synthase [Candidatus Methanoplasma sp.]
MSFKKVLNDIKNGKIILVYDFDDREREADMTIASQFVTVDALRRMRHDAGGLVCTTTPNRLAADLGLPFLSDVFWDAREKYPLLEAMAPNDIPYDNTKSSFGVTLNHRKTYTGITDADRALTITEYVKTIFGDAPVDQKIRDLGNNFRAPGHVHLLNTTKKILKTRRGHTELCTALMYMAGVHPSATLCEMMGDNGGATGKDRVMEYAEKNDMSFITGDEIISAWDDYLERTGADL